MQREQEAWEPHNYANALMPICTKAYPDNAFVKLP